MMCSCGRTSVESGNDLCAYCRDDWEAEQVAREQEDEFYAAQEAEHDAALEAEQVKS